MSWSINCFLLVLLGHILHHKHNIEGQEKSMLQKSNIANQQRQKVSCKGHFA